MESDYNSDLYRQSSFHREWNESKLVGFEDGMRRHPRKSALFKKNAIMSYLKSRMVKGSCLRELPFGSLQ